MGIANMSKVYLLAHQAEKDKVLETLQQSGDVEINNISESKGESVDWAEFVEIDQEQEALSTLDAKLAQVRFSLEFLHRYYPIKKSLLNSLSGTKPKIESAMFSQRAEEWAQVSEKVYRALKQIDEKLMYLRNEETRLHNLKAQLTPWETLEVSLEEIKATAMVHMELGVLSLSQMELLNDELQVAPTTLFLQEVSEQNGDVYVFVSYHNSDALVVHELLKEHDFSKEMFLQLTGTPADILHQISEELVAIEEERKIVLTKILAQVDQREAVYYYNDYLTVERDKKQAVANFTRTESAFLLEGWVRSNDVDQLRERLAKNCETVDMIIREPLPREAYPIALENKKYIAPFEFITKLYDHPSPYGLDPTPAMAPFFIIFFGLCMTDAGYGVILALLGALGLWVIKTGAARRLMWILVGGGLSTVLFGWLVGGWFGVPILGAPLFFDAMANPMQMLVYALALGIFQISIGMLIQAWRLIKEGKVLDALFDVGLWFLLFIGLAMYALPQTASLAPKVALAAVVGLIVTQGRAQEGLVKKFLSGLLSLYNITGYISDVLSYSRLMALGLATGVIALAINTMAGLLTGSILGYLIMIPLLLVGHTFNVVINALGSY
ncbi:MAG: V-type ATP synthase subunit I, partial [Firmicutes bacterium]|nr:V-type ATP synthase subunit I [Bacillota bacterium]